MARASAVRALSLADGRAESPLETRGRLRIVGAGLPTPELQVEIRGAGRLVGVVDAWFDEAAVAVEFDGRVKYTRPVARPLARAGRCGTRSDARTNCGHSTSASSASSTPISVRRWPAKEARLRALLASPGPGTRRFTATPRARGVPSRRLMSAVSWTVPRCGADISTAPRYSTARPGSRARLGLPVSSDGWRELSSPAERAVSPSSGKREIHDGPVADRAGHDQRPVPDRGLGHGLPGGPRDGADHPHRPARRHPLRPGRAPG